MELGPLIGKRSWGGIIGMRIAAENPDLVAAMAITNTGLPWRDMADPLPEKIEAAGGTVTVA